MIRSAFRHGYFMVNSEVYEREITFTSCTKPCLLAKQCGFSNWEFLRGFVDGDDDVSGYV